jgi:tetratricopeptide (TPR) repeat protein
MFKEGRRGEFTRRAGQFASRVLALTCLWLFSPQLEMRAEEAPAEADGPAEVAIATDMDEPARFVPHEEQALDLDLDFAADDDSQGDSSSGGNTNPSSHKRNTPTLASPDREAGDVLGDPSRLGDEDAQATPAEKAQAQERMERAHEMAKSAESGDDFAALIELCDKEATDTHWDGGRKYFRRLASWAHNRRGEASVNEGQAAEALADFDEALKLDPENWRAAHNRGVSRAEKGELARAVADFSHVIQLKPDYGPAYRNRGEVLFATGQYAKAIDDYTRAVAHMPQSHELYYLRASALHRAGRVREAIGDYDMSLAGDADDAERLIGRSGAHADLSNFAAAIADLDTAIKLAPQSAEAYRAVAWILATCPNARYRRPDKALLAARHALELQGKTDPAYFDTLAAAYAAAEDYEQAAAVQDQAIRLASGRDEKEALRTRLALYNQKRPYVGRVAAGANAASDDVSQQQEATPAAKARSSGPSGLRQPQRLAPPREVVLE